MRERPRGQEPRHEPDQRCDAEQDEAHPPSRPGHDLAAEIDAEGRTQRQARGKEAVGEPHPFRWQVLTEQLGAAGKGRALTDAQQQSQAEQKGEAVRQTGQCRRRGPDCQTRRQDQIGVELLGQPADHGVGGHIGPVEGGQQDAELAVRKLQLVPDQGTGGRQGPAVHIVDEHHHCEQADDDVPEHRPGDRGRSRSRRRHGCLLLTGHQPWGVRDQRPSASRNGERVVVVTPRRVSRRSRPPGRRRARHRGRGSGG